MAESDRPEGVDALIDFMNTASASQRPGIRSYSEQADELVLFAKHLEPLSCDAADCSLKLAEEMRAKERWYEKQVREMMKREHSVARFSKQIKDGKGECAAAPWANYIQTVVRRAPAFLNVALRCDELMACYELPVGVPGELARPLKLVGHILNLIGGVGSHRVTAAREALHKVLTLDYPPKGVAPRFDAGDEATAEAVRALLHVIRFLEEYRESDFPPVRMARNALASIMVFIGGNQFVEHVHALVGAV